MNHKEMINLSKTISYALRHRPEEFNLVLDKDGWTSVERLLGALKNNSKRYAGITMVDIADIVERDNKKRYELVDNKIRAVYGHSTQKKINKKPVEPPEILYHGTTPSSAEKILSSSMKPMNRQYVHLSKDVDTALVVAKRRTSEPVLLKVKAKQAYEDGIGFYQESTGIWLSDKIPAKYIEK